MDVRIPQQANVAGAAVINAASYRQQFDAAYPDETATTPTAD
jgi:hypothetical protein